MTPNQIESLRLPGESDTDFAERIGTTRMTLWNWLKGGKKPIRPYAKRLEQMMEEKKSRKELEK